MALFGPNHMTQTLPITYPTIAHKETPLSVYFTSTNRSVKTFLFIAGYNSKHQLKY